jgi:hypothetical protein
MLARWRHACYIETMSAQVLFNPLAYVDRLTRGGFTQEQARASAEALETAFSEGVATKADVTDSKRELQSSIDAFRHETKAGIEAFRHETKADIEALRRDTKADIDALRHETKADIEALRQETKADIEALRQETKASIEGLRQETKSSIDALRQETKSSIDGVKHEISLLKHDVGEIKRDIGEAEGRLRLEFKRDLSDIRLEIAQSKNETLRWLFGFVIVLIGAIFTIVKFVR